APARRAVDALAERGQEIRRLVFLPRLRSLDRLAPPLLPHDVQQPLAVRVLVPARVEVAREAVDQAQRHVEFLLVELPAAARPDVLVRTDLVRVVHLLEQENSVPYPQTRKLLAVAEEEVDERRELRLLHRLDEEAVDLLGPLGRPCVVGALEVDRVDLTVR